MEILLKIYRNKSDYQGSSGFTLLELLVSLSVVGVVLAAVLPQFSLLSDSFHRFNSKAIFAQDIKRMQAQALTEGCRGVMVINSANSEYEYGCDYLPYDVSETPQPDLISFRRILPTSVSLAVSGQVVFNSQGQTVDIFGIIQEVIVTFTDLSPSSSGVFATGKLLGTGHFSFESAEEEAEGS